MKTLTQPKRRGTTSVVLARVRKFIVSEDGPTTVEYAVMLAMIMGTCLASIGQVGSATGALWTDIDTKTAEAFAGQ